MATKPKNPLYVTPAGIAQYPYLSKPDTKFNPDGDYKVTLDIKSENAASLMQQLEDAHVKAMEDAKAENKGKRIKEGELPFIVNEDAGTVSFKFKLKAKVTPKKGDPFEQKPSLVDAKRKPLPASAKIGGGSTIKVAFEIIPYYTAIAGAGVSLRLKAVQVLDLKEYSGNGAAGAFGEEDGFEAEASSADESEDDTTADGSDDF